MNKHLTIFAGIAFAVASSAAQTTPPAGQTGSQSGQTRPQTGSQTGQSGSMTGGANRLMAADSNFATKAAMSGMAEVELGNLARDRASSAEVKRFAQTMVDDHTKANAELKQIASSKGITLPSTLDAKHQATRDRLSKLSGAEFDRAYMKEKVADHKEAVSDFRTQSQEGKDTELKAFASKTLPKLEQHHQQAQTVEASVTGGAKNSTGKQ